MKWQLLSSWLPLFSQIWRGWLVIDRNHAVWFIHANRETQSNNIKGLWKTLKPDKSTMAGSYCMFTCWWRRCHGVLVKLEVLVGTVQPFQSQLTPFPIVWKQSLYMWGLLIGGRANVYLLGHSRLQCVEIVLEGAYSYVIVLKNCWGD